MSNIQNSAIKPHSVILFQGDSITDAGRSRFTIGANSPRGMGEGYPRLIADRLLENSPDQSYQFYNRGVSGNRIRDLAQRWDHDSIRLVPDLISILIGVNDTWNYLFTGLGSDPEDFREIYKQILTDTRKQLPDTRLVFCEPFILLTCEVSEEWTEDISKRQAYIRELAREFDGKYVPFQSALDQANKNIPAHRLLEDGVHPTPQGHQVLADCWLETVVG
ncbi:MAG: SGNH/GDSL hydrolase family protein [Chloroflexi bacterium]|nr:SGNH/GDSL hydrolase family protein [Chloroflexota bacterium]